MKTCFHSDVAAPDALPALGVSGFYVMPAIVSEGRTLAPEKRYRVVVVGHIGAFGLRLRERSPRPDLVREIETHFGTFEPARFDYVKQAEAGAGMPGGFYVVRESGISRLYPTFDQAAQAVFNA